MKRYRSYLHNSIEENFFVLNSLERIIDAAASLVRATVTLLATIVANSISNTGNQTGRQDSPGVVTRVSGPAQHTDIILRLGQRAARIRESIMKSATPLLSALVLSAFLLPAQEYNIIHSWTGNTGNFEPDSPMVMDSQGNLYGTLAGGVFKLSPPSEAGGQWTEQVLIDSTGPSVRLPSHGLLFDSAGNLYGVSTNEGTVDGQAVTGYIAEVSPPSTPGGTWTSKILYLFPDDQTTSSTNCEAPQSYLTMDSKGNLYGTCINAGANGVGGVYELSPPTQAGGQWTQQLLHSWALDGVDGNGPGPEAGLILDAHGNLYGTTENGGTNNLGVAFELSPSSGGEWTETILYTFGEGGGPNTPMGALVFDHQGNLYTTTADGGTPGAGAVVELSPPANQGSEWTLTQLYGFGGKATTGRNPAIGVLFDAAGNLWGTTTHGSTYYSTGPANTDGVLFELMPQAGGGWQEVVRHLFGAPGDVLGAGSPMVIDSKGNLYGGGSGCSSTTCTAIFEYSPSGSASAPAPSIAAGGVVNGASFGSGLVVGSWATIEGTNFASSTGTWDVVNGILPTKVNDVTVNFGGNDAYVYYVTPTQINFIVPDVPTGTQQVTVTNAAGTSQSVSVTVDNFAPAFFLWPNNQVVATYQDFTYAAASGTFAGVTTTPAKPGDTIILWGTGFGSTNPAFPQGMVTPSSTTYNTDKVTVTINNLPATVYGAALAPGFAGLYQIAIQVPNALESGNWPVVAGIGGVSSPSGVVLTVQ